MTQPVTVPRTLPALFERSVARCAERPALITRDERWSYRALADQVDRYARGLVALGVHKGTRVGLLLENRPEWIAFAFAATGIGAVLVPLSTFVRQDDLAYQLRHADVAQLYLGASFLDNDYLGMLGALAPELDRCAPGAIHSPAVPALRRVVVRGRAALPRAAQPWSDLSAAAEAVPGALLAPLRAEVNAADECYLLHTSGTTALPKGVVHVHAAVAGNGWWIGEYQGLEPGDVAWFYFPLFFSAGCINVMLGTLSHGAALILQPTFDPGVALELIERERATTWHLWPHMLKKLQEHPDWQWRDHSGLHKGTAPFDVILGRRAEDGLGGVHMYGMTETCTAFTCTRADDPGEVRLRTQGRPLPGNALRIVDPDTGATLPTGASGEICVRGPAVLRRYYKLDVATLLDAEGYFHTGDRGYVDADGRLHFEQRIKDMIKAGGINVSPAALEEKLVRIPGVAAAYAFPLTAADGEEVVGAALVPAPASAVADADILAFCAAELASYQRPRALLVLDGAAVPMTDSGKVRKAALRERLSAALAAGRGPVVHLAQGER
jgi:fatty-acyl-CoA synthase